MADSTPRRKILLTGSNGQLGIHTCIHLEHCHGAEIVTADRRMMGTENDLAAAVAAVDGIIHVAGINRATESEVMEGNALLAESLVKACRRAGKTPPLVYANSIHARTGTNYGRAKENAAAVLARHWLGQNAVFADLLLPNLFGEFSKPNYNNFTGTFCHQIALGGEPGVDSDTTVSLLHYGDAAETLIAALWAGASIQKSVAGHATTVGTVAHRLKSMYADYVTGVFPALESKFEVQLFNALRQVMFDTAMPGRLARHSDVRGSFFECVRAYPSGQTSFSTTQPGITRGNHFHFHKIERFIVVAGEACIRVRSLADEKTRVFDVTGTKPVYIDVPPLHTHNITNTGPGELLTLFWVNGFFDPNDPDTYLEPV